MAGRALPLNPVFGEEVDAGVSTVGVILPGHVGVL
jgi:hypothetical protein